MSSSKSAWDFEATTSAHDGGKEGDEQEGGGTYAICNEINMTNCYKRCEFFFNSYACIHFKVLIAYWILAGYLGNHVRSVEEAYEKGVNCLFDLVFKEKILKLSDHDRNMVEFAGSSTSANCRHPGFCFPKDVFREVIMFTPVFSEGLSSVKKVVLSNNEMLSMSGRASVLRWAQNVGRDEYFALFNPSPDSLKALLENVKNPSMLLLRGFDKLSLPIDHLPLSMHLSFLEISNSSRLTTIPENINSKLKCLRYLNLSYLPIEEFPSNFFWSFYSLHCLILRGCGKLLSLDLGRGAIHCSVLDLSHCTALQNFVYPPYTSWLSTVTVLDISYTPFDPCQLISSARDLSHLYLRGSKLEDFSFLLQSQSIQILDLSGCSCFTQLDEGLVNNMSKLQKLDLSCTKVKQLPSLANLTMLHVVSLRGLELDSLETLASLSDCLVELDLSGLKIISSSHLELKLDFLQSLKNLQILNLSQTSVAKLPDISTLVSLRVLLLADCEHLKALPDLQPLTNLETLDLSLQSSSCSNNLPLEFETKGHLSTFALPKSIRKLVLTNRSGIQKLLPVTTLANLNLELLDLRGTDVVGLDSILESQQPHERISRPIEVHIVSTYEESNSQQPNQPSYFYGYNNRFIRWDELISDIQNSLNSVMAQYEVERVHNDLSYIKTYYEKYKSSSKELLQELMDAASNLSKTGFAPDSASIKKLLQIVVKFKLLVARRQIDELKALEVTEQKQKKTIYRKSQSQENNAMIMTEIARGMKEMELDLLSSYRSLSPIQKNCLLCFSIFPYSEGREKNTGLLKSLVIKKKILIYWWVGEGFIDPHRKENVDFELCLSQNPNPDPHTNTNTNTGQNMTMSREIEERREHAIEQLSAANLVRKPITIEEMGKHILNVLAKKGFIEHVIKKGRESGHCCIHPFVHSFVIERAKEECFFDFDRKTGKLTSHFTRSQRACLLESHDSIPSSCELWASYISSPNMLKSFKTVKTLFNVNDSFIDIKQEWFSKMKNLSVLHLGIWNSENINLIEVSDQTFMEDLKNMRQVRLLSLQGLPTIKKLPDSVCYLRNLVILDLKECSYLEELPADIGFLKSLTHLDISNCALLYKLPKGISMLCKLEVLRGFVITDVFQPARDSQVTSVSISILSHWRDKIKQCGLFCCMTNEACTLRDLLKLENLRELSIVVNISKFPEHEDLLVFKEMNKLCKLKILWQRSICTDNTESASSQELSDDRGENKHLDSIEKLELWCFPYERAPYWLNPTELKNLKKLHIVGGNLREIHGLGADGSRWNVGALRLKYLRNLDIHWRQLKMLFPQMVYLEMAQCDQLVLFPCNEEGVWRSASRYT